MRLQEWRVDRSRNEELDLPSLFTLAYLNWDEGEREVAGVGRVPLYRGVDWFSEELRRPRVAPSRDWLALMARACCRVLAELDPGTGPEEMLEHLPESLHDEWVRHAEYAAWIGSNPERAFAQLDVVRQECPELSTAQAAEVAMQREAAALGAALLEAAEREWHARACPSCGEYPFADAPACPSCRSRRTTSRRERPG